MKPKTAKEIELLAEGGHILACIMKDLVARCVAGANASDLDALAEEEIRKAGGSPSFKGFGKPGEEFPNVLCVSPNDMLVHGIPHKDLAFREGDLIGLDLGLEYKGLYTDHAVTVPIGDISEEDERLLAVTRECLERGIAQAVAGNHLGDIGHAVQEYAEKLGYGVIRKLTGHAVGYSVHEEPRIPNFGKAGSGEKIMAGAVLAIEPMIAIGGADVKTADDGWGVVTADGARAAHFEHTVVAATNGPRILTQ
ncbi:MAG: type I methionyl aminopeptidase [Parcubacteria group bacterium]|nr:type I methionyl aminopeptidase [Parcubacteria group bacterium]